MHNKKYFYFQKQKRMYCHKYFNKSNIYFERKNCRQGKKAILLTHIQRGNKNLNILAIHKSLK